MNLLKKVTNKPLILDQGRTIRRTIVIQLSINHILYTPCRPLCFSSKVAIPSSKWGRVGGGVGLGVTANQIYRQVLIEKFRSYHSRSIINSRT